MENEKQGREFLNTIVTIIFHAFPKTAIFIDFSKETIIYNEGEHFVLQNTVP